MSLNMHVGHAKTECHLSACVSLHLYVACVLTTNACPVRHGSSVADLLVVPVASRDVH